MATGDTPDVVNRLRAVLPPWFPDLANAPVLNAILTGISDGFAFVYSYLQFAALQTRITTATGGWLDLIAWDYFGARFLRRPNEFDASFGPRVKQEILRPRDTRAAILLMLQQLTGAAGTVQEAWNPLDWGGYGQGVCGYGAAIGYGSLQFNNQVFVKAVRPNGNGIPFIAGYGTVGAGYGVGPIEYADLSQIAGPVTDAEIYARIAQTVAAGITAWTDIVSSGSQVNGQVTFTATPQTVGLEVWPSWF